MFNATFDWVFFGRPDLYWRYPIGDLRAFKKTIYTTQVYHAGSVNDKWALVPRPLLDIYTSAYGEHNRYKCPSEDEHKHCLSGHGGALFYSR